MCEIYISFNIHEKDTLIVLYIKVATHWIGPFVQIAPGADYINALHMNSLA